MHPPLGADPVHGERSRAAVHGRTRPERSTRQPTRIAQGIQVSAATVQHRDPVTPGTGRALEARALQQLDRSAAACKLFGGNAHQRRRLHPYRRAQRPVSTCITTNAMALDEIENELRCAAGEGVHAAAQLLAELTLHLVRIVLETGIDLTTVSAGCAPARFLGLQQHDLCALLREMQGRRQSGDASAHHDDVGSYIPVEGRRGSRRLRGILIEIRHVNG